MFYSVGERDNTLVEWRIELINDSGDFSRPFGESDVPNILEKPNIGISKFSMSIQSNIQSIPVDEIFKREKDYCYFLNNISDRLKDNFLLFRGTN
jgi:hypothetical protein